MSIPDPYGRSTFHGKPLDNATIAALKIAEAKLGYPLTIVQGIGGAAASGNTHLEGRAVDLAPWDHERKVRVLKDIGFAVWYREELPGTWAPHIHAVLIFENRSNSRGLNDVGFRQIAAFDAGRDGLVGNRVDGSYRPEPKAVFTLEEYRRFHEGAGVAAVARPTNVSRARMRVDEARQAVWQAEALLKDAEGRPLAQSQLDELMAARKILKGVLETLPER